MQVEKEMLCIICPVGCKLKILINNGNIEKIVGNECNRGIKYANSEIKNPTRTLTTTIKVINGIYNVCPVKTDGEIPKKLIFQCMKVINKLSVKAPIKIHQVIIENILNTGVNIVTTRNLEKN